MRSLLLACVLAALAVTLSAAGASAAITLTYSGTTIGISGTGNNETYVGFSTTLVPSGAVTVRNSTGVIDNSGGACTAQVLPVLGTYFHCPAAATTVDVRYGAGNDSFTLEGVCVPFVRAVLGDGANEFWQSYTDTCPPDTVANVTGGSGPDTILGGAGSDTLDGAGGNNEIRGYEGDDTIRGGAGNDRLTGHGGNDAITAGEGDDRIEGNDGNDLEDGGGGNDTIAADSGDAGADDLRGGPGTDELWLNGHAGAVTVTLDEQANDGSPGEGDNVHADFEKYILTPGDDVFVGSAGRDVVDPWGGSDVVRAGDGDDEIIDFSGGDDQLFGEGGNDQLAGGSGNDLIDGGPGIDALFGDGRECSSWSCPAGADRLFARDGAADAVNCGAGADSAQVDAADVVAADGFQACEAVDRAAAPVVPPPPAPRARGDPPAAPGGNGGRPAPAFSAARALGGRRRFTLTLRLAKAATVTVTVSRRGARRPLGRLTFRARKGKGSWTIRKVGRTTLRRGSYRLLVKVGATSKTLDVKVR